LEQLAELMNVSVGIAWAVAALVVVQLTLQVVVLVDLARRPADRLNGSRWLWATVVVLGEIVGAVIYLAIARRPAPAVEGERNLPAGDRAAAAADLLYGPAEKR